MIVEFITVDMIDLISWPTWPDEEICDDSVNTIVFASELNDNVSLLIDSGLYFLSFLIEDGSIYHDSIL